MAARWEHLGFPQRIELLIIFQIKNATSIAVKLAAESEGKVLATADILSAAKTLQNFGFVKEKIKPRSVSPRPPPPPHKPSTSIHLIPSELRR